MPALLDPMLELVNDTFLAIHFDQISNIWGIMHTHIFGGVKVKREIINEKWNDKREIIKMVNLGLCRSTNFFIRNLAKVVGLNFVS